MKRKTPKGIAALEKKARRLEPSVSEFRKMIRQMEREATQFLSRLPDHKTFEEKGRRYPRATAKKGVGVSRATRELMQRLTGPGLATTSGSFFGYIPGGGLLTAAVAEFLVAVTNRYSSVYRVAPDSVELENDLIREFCEQFGFPKGAWGTLMSGGSLATVVALAAARDRLRQEDWGRAALYTTSEAHNCLGRALKLLGLGGATYREVPVDAAWRMDPTLLKRQIETDLSLGLIPWVVYANLGTVNSGAVDPLTALLELKSEFGFWLHADGAYGGFFQLTQKGKKLYRGIERVDSLVLDPHKGMFLPYGVGAVLVRDGAGLRKAFTSESGLSRY